MPSSSLFFFGRENEFVPTSVSFFLFVEKTIEALFLSRPSAVASSLGGGSLAAFLGTSRAPHRALSSAEDATGEESREGAKKKGRKVERDTAIDFFFSTSTPRSPKNPEEEENRKMDSSSSSAPSPVLLHIYDVTNASSSAINATVTGLNRLTKDILGPGGVFHGGKERERER